MGSSSSKKNKKKNSDKDWEILLWLAKQLAKALMYKGSGFSGLFRGGRGYSGGRGNSAGGYGGYGKNGGVTRKFTDQSTNSGNSAKNKQSGGSGQDTVGTKMSGIFGTNGKHYSATGGGVGGAVGGFGVGGHGGGWAATAFKNIVDAHSSAEGVVNEFELDKEENSYNCTAWSDAYKEQYDIASEIYRENVEYLLGIIEELTADMNMCIEEAEQLLAEAESLRAEAQSLMDDAESCEDPEEAFELMEEAQELNDEADELQEQAEALQTQATELQAQIDVTYSDIDMLTIEENIDYDEVERNAHTYACEFAEQWIDGIEWIPSDVLDWAFYEVSDHNKH